MTTNKDLSIADFVLANKDKAMENLLVESDEKPAPANIAKQTKKSKAEELLCFEIYKTDDTIIKSLKEVINGSGKTRGELAAFCTKATDERSLEDIENKISVPKSYNLIYGLEKERGSINTETLSFWCKFLKCVLSLTPMDLDMFEREDIIDDK